MTHLTDDERAILAEIAADAEPDDDEDDAEAVALMEEIARINAEAFDAHYAHQAWCAEQMAKEREREAAYRTALAACEGDDGLF